MAFTGVHYSVRFARNVPGNEFAATLPAGAAIASETMGSAGTSTVVAPAGRTIGSINASAPIYYAVGSTPDPTSGPRNYYDPTNNPREDFVLSEGDQFAWILA